MGFTGDLHGGKAGPLCVRGANAQLSGWQNKQTLPSVLFPACAHGVTGTSPLPTGGKRLAKDDGQGPTVTQTQVDAGSKILG